MKNEKKEIRYFSMFTGVGGFELGLERTTDLRWLQQTNEEGENNKNIEEQRGMCNSRKFTCVGFSEIDKYCKELLAKKFPNVKNYGDATKINPRKLPEFDMLCGGFPCQAFSIAGKRRGFQDTRGTLFFEIARIIKAKKPKIIFLENVKGLLNHSKGKTFSIILQTLSELGYDVQWMVLNSKFFGVPQNRERVFIIGSLRGTSRQEILPFRKVNKSPDEEYKEKDSQSQTITATYWKGGKGTHIQAIDVYNKKMRNEIPSLSHPCHNNIRLVHKSKDQYWRVYGDSGLSPTLAGASKLSGDCTPKIMAVLTPDRENKRQNGRRFKEDGEPSFTLTGQDIHGVMTMNTIQEAVGSRQGSSASFKKSIKNIHQSIGEIRRLTPIECERLQGFPDEWTRWGTDDNGITIELSDTQRYKMMGNAVTTNVIKAIAEKLLIV